MNSNRSQILDWFEQHLIPRSKLRSALHVAAVLPTAITWQLFLDRLLLFMGVGALAAGIIFFFAFNWQDLDRFAKFALAEVPIVAALIFVWRVGVDTIVGKATLLFAASLAGALLALVGQTYQTGADTFELFIAWAAVFSAPRDDTARASCGNGAKRKLLSLSFLARPATIPRARVAETGPKGNSYHFNG